MKWIAVGGLTAWAGIVRLAWVLADKRIGLCGYPSYSNCEVRATATRDAVLIWGPTIALVAIIAFAIASLYARLRRDARDPFQPSNPEFVSRSTTSVTADYVARPVTQARRVAQTVSARLKRLTLGWRLAILSLAMVIVTFALVAVLMGSDASSNAEARSGAYDQVIPGHSAAAAYDAEANEIANTAMSEADADAVAASDAWPGAPVKEEPTPEPWEKYRNNDPYSDIARPLSPSTQSWRDKVIHVEDGLTSSEPASD